MVRYYSYASLPLSKTEKDLPHRLVQDHRYPKRFWQGTITLA